MTKDTAPVLIAGGGIAGLAAALAFAKHGLASEVLEREPAFSESGAGIQLGPNAVRVLEKLGAAKHLKPYIVAPENLIVRDGRSGKTLTKMPLGQTMAARHGAPYWTAHRGDVLNALLSAARAQPGITLSTGFEVASLSQDDRRVHAISNDGRTRQGELLVGADGRWSAVRRLALGDVRLPFSDYVAYRAVVPVDAIPAPLQGANVHVWLAPNCHVVHYPVRAGREHALVVVLEEPGTFEGWSTDADVAHVQRATKNLAANLSELIHAAASWRKWALSDPAPFAAWSKGRVALIGDAAHPVLPFLAQGGALALEDAVVLAREAAVNLHRPWDALDRYQRQRLARASRVQAAARRNGRIYHLSGMSAIARNTVLRAVPPARMIASYDWLYGWRADI